MSTPSLPPDWDQDDAAMVGLDLDLPIDAWGSYRHTTASGTVGGWYLFNINGNVPLAKAYWSAYQRLGSQRRMMWDVKSWYQARSAPLQFQIGKVICTSGV